MIDRETNQGGSPDKREHPDDEQGPEGPIRPAPSTGHCSMLKTSPAVDKDDDAIKVKVTV